MRLIEAQKIVHQADIDLILNIIKYLELSNLEVKVDIPPYWILTCQDQAIDFTVHDLRSDRKYVGTIPWKFAIAGMEDQIAVLN